MKLAVFSQVCPFFVRVFEADTWQYPLHRHTHYELIYILHGEGTHQLNDQHYPYQGGDVFLCTPHDTHHFIIAQPTRFCLIKLNLGFLLQANETFALLQPLLETGEPPAPFVFDAATQAYLRSQIEFCIREFHERPFLYAQTIQASVLSMLVLLARERLRQPHQPAAATHAAQDIVPALIHYLHAHLREPARLTALAVAAHFALNPRYIGQYFRRHTGQSLKGFIQQSRIRALQLQLEFSDKTVSVLAEEYGYTDESHLTKAFRAMTHQTPTQYRAQVQQARTLLSAER
jgi:AraC-like DNA-binding protein